MIKYSLVCAEDHRFDSWFASAEAFDSLDASGMLTCAVCGGGGVRKAMMAPRVRPARKAASGGAQLPAPASAAVPGPTPEPSVPMQALSSAHERAMRELRKRIEQSSEYVGRDFAREARAIHDGEAPERTIHGEASAPEVRSLLEEGVPVAPLPFRPTRKMN